MRTLCYSVRLRSLTPVSERAFRAVGYDGKSDIIPASQVFGQDYEVVKSDAWWISAWILEKKSLQFSKKKAVYFDDAGRMLPNVIVEHHVPQAVDAVPDNLIDTLHR